MLRTLIDSLPDVVYVKDRQARILLSNRANLAALNAASLEEAVGKTDFDFYPRELAEKFFADDQAVMESGRPLINREEPGRLSSGKMRWVLTTKVPFRDAAGRVAGLIGIGRDISDLKDAASRIREQTQMLDQARDGIIITDLDHTVLYWNGGAERLFGWTAEEVLGKTAEGIYAAKDLPQIAASRAETLAKGEWRGEMVLHNREGREITIETRRTLIRDELGRPKAHLSINSDVSDRKRLEAQLLRSQRMESIGTLAGGIAHDLNNILGPILMSVSLLKPKVSDAEGEKLLDLLESSTKRGANLVQQVLMFGRGVEGRRVAIDPAKILRDLAQIVHNTFPRSIQLQTKIPDGLWPISGDPTQIEQVLMNLLVNARDAMPDGGALTFSLENISIDEAYAGMNPESRPGDYVALQVMDTGTGIPLEVRDRIFEPFFTTKGVGKGTGLGLSTTLAIVKSHQGFINVYSDVGRGTTFRVYLPAQREGAGGDGAGTEQPSLPRGNGELILVVDDEEAIRTITKKILEQFNYRALLAGNGAEAISIFALKKDEIAAVITDMEMPVMGGPATVFALRAIRAEVKIIGSSGLNSNRSVAKALGAGVAQFIPKPYTADILLKALQRLLKREAV